MSAILGGISFLLGACVIGIGCYLVGEYEFGKLEVASQRALELEPFVRDLRRFILDQSGSIMDWPEAKTKATDCRRQLRVIMKDNIQTVEA